MIDFIKIRIIDNEIIQFFRSHPKIYFHSSNERLLEDNETIQGKETKQFEGVIFEFIGNNLYISIKPHYNFNGGLHNANDFPVIECRRTLSKFISSFGIDPEELPIVNIEFGLNIVIPENLIDVRDLLAYLIYHEKNEFHTDRKYIYCRFSNSTNKEGTANVYKIIKAYAKGIQFPEYTHPNTFRFEVKSNRRRYIQSLGVHNLGDLLKPEIYETLSGHILKEFDEVLIIDEKAKPVLSKTKLKNHKRKLNQIFWRKLLYKSRNTFRSNFNKYYNALDTCETHLKKELRNLISDKLQELKKCADLTLCIDEIRTPYVRRCKITQLDISMQKKGSELLSHTGLRYYFRNDPFTFNYIKNKYLSNRWVNSDFETQITEIAHNIRNHKHNNEVRLLKNHNPQQVAMF